MELTRTRSARPWQSRRSDPLHSDQSPLGYCRAWGTRPGARPPSGGVTEDGRQLRSPLVRCRLSGASRREAIRDRDIAIIAARVAGASLGGIAADFGIHPVHGAPGAEPWWCANQDRIDAGSGGPTGQLGGRWAKRWMWKGGRCWTGVCHKPTPERCRLSGASRREAIRDRDIAIIAARVAGASLGGIAADFGIHPVHGAPGAEPWWCANQDRIDAGSGGPTGQLGGRWAKRWMWKGGRCWTGVCHKPTPEGLGHLVAALDVVLDSRTSVPAGLPFPSGA